MLELVELTEWRERLVRTLSVGMKRRVEIARALIHDCAHPVPRRADRRARRAVARADLAVYPAPAPERELTVVVTTHYIEEVEDGDRVCIIDHGQILAIDTPAALKARARSAAACGWCRREEATAAEIMPAYPDTTIRNDAEIIVKSSGDAFAEAFLSRYGSRIRRLSVEEPSLESVFLSLTGREIRDQAAGARERTLAFGRQGGSTRDEHDRDGTAPAPRARIRAAAAAASTRSGSAR